MSEVSNRRFVHFSGTKQDFIDSGYPEQYYNSIVFIEGEDDDRSIYTHGNIWGDNPIIGTSTGCFVSKFGFSEIDELTYHSFALGSNNFIAGDYSFANGNENVITGTASMVSGEDNIIEGGDGCIVLGISNCIQGSHYSVALGINNIIEYEGYHNYVMGADNTITGQTSNSCIIGTNNYTCCNNCVLIGDSNASENEYGVPGYFFGQNNNGWGYAIGENNVGSGGISFMIGTNNIISSAEHSVSIGSDNNIDADNSMVFGTNNHVYGSGGFVMGDNLICASGSTVIGKYNKLTKAQYFVVGCGTDDTDRKNAIEVTATGIYQLIDDVLVKLTETTISEINQFSKSDNEYNDIFDASVDASVGY